MHEGLIKEADNGEDISAGALPREEPTPIHHNGTLSRITKPSLSLHKCELKAAQELRFDPWRGDFFSICEVCVLGMG